MMLNARELYKIYLIFSAHQLAHLQIRFITTITLCAAAAKCNGIRFNLNYRGMHLKMILIVVKLLKRLSSQFGHYFHCKHVMALSYEYIVSKAYRQPRIGD